MDGGAFTTVHVTTDPAEGAMLTEVLQNEAILARLVHVNGPLLGVGQQAFQTRVEVLTPSAPQARELLADLQYVGAAEAADSPTPPDEAKSPRRLRLAAGMVYWPGCSHAYARHLWTGVVLDLGLVACIANLFLNALDRYFNDFTLDVLFGTGCAILVCDSVGGVLAARALNRGARVPSRAGQVARGLVLLLVAALLGSANAAAGAIPSWLKARRLATLRISCSEGSVTVDSHSDRMMLVFVDRMVVTSPDGTQVAEIVDRSVHAVDGGGRAEVAVQVPEWVRDECAAPLRPRGDFDCRFVFDLSAHDPKADLERDDSIRASGACLPPWGHPDEARAGILTTRR